MKTLFSRKRLRTIFWDYEVERLKEALDNKEVYHSWRVKPYNWWYEYSLDVEWWEDNWPMRLFLSEEYIWCGNWHYYVWNNWNSFIYIEKD